MHRYKFIPTFAKWNWKSNYMVSLQFAWNCSLWNLKKLVTHTLNRIWLLFCAYDIFRFAFSKRISLEFEQSLFKWNRNLIISITSYKKKYYNIGVKRKIRDPVCTNLKISGKSLSTYKCPIYKLSINRVQRKKKKFKIISSISIFWLWVR